MKFNKNWLEEWVDCSTMSSQELADKLTMAGLEVDAVTPVAPAFSGVIVGEIVGIKQHPDADKLRVCQVAGHPEGTLQVVCGAANARLGLKTPFALIGAILPGDFKIKKAKIRGAESCGMLCAQQELGLSDSSDGIWELPADAPVGANFREWLELDDDIIELDLTPNRGDCLSIKGLAREVYALTGLTHTPLEINKVPPTIDEALDIKIKSSGCGRYDGRVIRNVDISKPTPIWMLERLRRAGVRNINAVVDVTNYVMLELGQPMHAFDLDKLQGGITVRMAHAGENIDLLDGSIKTLTPDTLVIADDSGAIAIAGIMGGAASAVSANTQNIWLESVFFDPMAIAGKARSYGLHTDASHRFERGVDFDLQSDAIERATELLLSITGGKAGKTILMVGYTIEKGKRVRSTSEAFSATKESAEVFNVMLPLRHEKLDSYLGAQLGEAEVTAILQRLGFSVQNKPAERISYVVVPSWRFDINRKKDLIEVDLIEEIARVYGYNKLPSRSITASLDLTAVPETVLPLDTLLQTLVARGYREVISYSFISPELQKQFEPNESSVSVRNPISADLSEMRASLIPSLVRSLQHNLNRQQTRARFFESGLRFRIRDGKIQQQPVFSGLLYGSRMPETWSVDNTVNVDFFDLKGDVEALLAQTGRTGDFSFEATHHPAMHPGQTAAVLECGQPIGIIGALHPELQKTLDIPQPVLVFELEREALLKAREVEFRPLSRFPEVRRDLAVVVARDLPVAELLATVKKTADESLIKLSVFDIYCGEHIDSNRKSVALSLIFQHTSRTLNDVEIAAWISRVVEVLYIEHKASLRN